MRRIPHFAVLCLFSLGGCLGGSLGGGTGGMHGAGGVPGTGGAPATGGAFGTGGAPGTGGSASPGSVVLQIVLPPGRTYCDENPSCIGVQHLTLLTASGQPVNFGSSLGCGISCEACAAIPCPELPVIACPAGPFGVSVESYTLTWDGSYTEQDSCRPSGSSLTQSCYASKFAAPGTYVARFCATPGTLALTDGGPAYTCTATGTQECVEVGFLFPSPQPVTITLPVD